VEGEEVVLRMQQVLSTEGAQSIEGMEGEEEWRVWKEGIVSIEKVVRKDSSLNNNNSRSAQTNTGSLFRTQL
jgi:hypothetical protein